MQVYINGVPEEVVAVHVLDAGVWVDAPSVHVRDNDAWAEVVIAPEPAP